jgi:hypothetical protein
VRFIDEEVIDAELVEDQAVVLLALRQQVAQPFIAALLLFLEGLEDVVLAPLAGLLGGAFGVLQQDLVLGDLLAQELGLVGLGQADALERAVRHDDAVPVAAGDFGG